MKLVRTLDDLQTELAIWRGDGARVSLVPTMGNLHAGHLSLVERAAQLGQRVVVTIFVNPLQFAPGDDYDTYPRTLSDDLKVLETLPVDLVFAPETSTLYPRPQEQMTRVAVPELSEQLCGAFRPGHFDGVTTVVSLLFNIVRPHVAVFGEKDYQQLVIIRRMVADQRIPVEVVGAPTLREESGLALSSRNRYLDERQRDQSISISFALAETVEALRQGRRDYPGLEASGMDALRRAGLEPQYLAIRAPDLSLPEADARRFVVLAAAKAGTTRLIDNMQLVLDE